MIRHAAIFWVAVAGLFLSGLTIVGSEVRSRDHALAELHDAIERERETIHVLRAERAYLSSPDRIAERAKQELHLVELKGDRFRDIASLPRWIPSPDLEIAPAETRPLLLSSFDGEGAPGGDLIDAAVFSPLTGLDIAGLAAQMSAMAYSAGTATE